MFTIVQLIWSQTTYRFAPKQLEKLVSKIENSPTDEALDPLRALPPQRVPGATVRTVGICAGKRRRCSEDRGAGEGVCGGAAGDGGRAVLLAGFGEDLRKTVDV